MVIRYSEVLAGRSVFGKFMNLQTEAAELREKINYVI